MGGQQCTGLASQLIQSRKESNYLKYNISSITKPGAGAEEVLKPSYKLKDSQDNCLIACVRENNTNPNKIIIELSAMLKCFQYTQIIVLKVLHNESLNEYMLNTTLKNICKNFTNCTFVDINPYNYYYKNKFNYFSYVCKQINYVIDSNYYDRYFLRYKSTNVQPRLLQSNPKKGTIPFYFPLVDKKNATVPINYPMQFFRV